MKHHHHKLLKYKTDKFKLFIVSTGSIGLVSSFCKNLKFLKILKFLKFYGTIEL